MDKEVQGTEEKWSHLTASYLSGVPLTGSLLYFKSQNMAKLHEIFDLYLKRPVALAPYSRVLK